MTSTIIKRKVSVLAKLESGITFPVVSVVSERLLFWKLIEFLSGWVQAKNNVLIDYDLENIPLQIQTDSVLGSKDLLWVMFYNSAGTQLGFVALTWNTHLKYRIGFCMGNMIDTPNPLPSGNPKVWKITKTGAVSVTVHCNGEKVLDITFSSSVCDCGCAWLNQWNQGMSKKIQFHDKDTASDFWGPTPGTFHLLASLLMGQIVRQSIHTFNCCRTEIVPCRVALINALCADIPDRPLIDYSILLLYTDLNVRHK